MEYDLDEDQLAVAFGCPEPPGIPTFISLNNRTDRQSGLDPRISGEVTLRTRIPFNMLIYGVEYSAIDDTTGLFTNRFGVNWRDSASQDWWVNTTGPQGAGAAVPILLLAGDNGEEFIWPAPRILKEGGTLQCKVVPETDTTIRTLIITFHGRRLRGQEALNQLCEDPNKSGYSAIAFSPILVPVPGDAAADMGIVGPQQRRSAGIEVLTYDFFISGVSQMISAEASLFTQQPGCVTRLQLRQDVGKQEIFGEGILSNTLGGMQNDPTANDQAYREVAHSFKACWRVFQESGLSLGVEFFSCPVALGETHLKQFFVLHGQRGVAQMLPPFTSRQWLMIRPEDCPDLRFSQPEPPIMSPPEQARQVFGRHQVGPGSGQVRAVRYGNTPLMPPNAPGPNNIPVYPPQQMLPRPQGPRPTTQGRRQSFRERFSDRNRRGNNGGQQ